MAGITPPPIRDSDSALSKIRSGDYSVIIRIPPYIIFLVRDALIFYGHFLDEGMRRPHPSAHVTRRYLATTFSFPSTVNDNAPPTPTHRKPTLKLTSILWFHSSIYIYQSLCYCELDSSVPASNHPPAVDSSPLARHIITTHRVRNCC